jgi:hypothetical protein
MRSADQAMYEVKRRGKGRFVPYSILGAEGIELVPAADADARIAETAFQRDGSRNRHFPLPSRAKSL